MNSDVTACKCLCHHSHLHLAEKYWNFRKQQKEWAYVTLGKIQADKQARTEGRRMQGAKWKIHVWSKVECRSASCIRDTCLSLLYFPTKEVVDEEWHRQAAQIAALRCTRDGIIIYLPAGNKAEKRNMRLKTYNHKRSWLLENCQSAHTT